MSDKPVSTDPEAKLEKPFVHGVKCPRCNDRLWSRFGHDFHYCRCQYTFVDGGRHYLRYGYGDAFSGEDTHGKPETIIIDTSNPDDYND